MTDLSDARLRGGYADGDSNRDRAARGPLRFVTAAALFDGHDASINIIRRVLQAAGCEVIHLGHDRSVEVVVTAALQEDADAIAVSSYQGGHVEYFRYMVEQLHARGGAHIRVFGGGGGVIVPDEIALLHAAGVTRLYSAQDGQALGLRGMVDDMIARCYAAPRPAPVEVGDVLAGRDMALARYLSQCAGGRVLAETRAAVQAAAMIRRVPVLGITGTGGAGKSSLTDELIRRFRLDDAETLRIAILCVDPSRRKSGGALLGDRIRMNAIHHPRIFMHSLATRDSVAEVPAHLPDAIDACKVSGFDLIVVETSGIGQGDAAIVPLADVSLYVMTPEFGAASQLEKIDMLDFADFVVINKFDRRGAADAWRDVAKQVQRNRECWNVAPEDMPVYGTQASRFNDSGVTALYHALRTALVPHGLPPSGARLAHPAGKTTALGQAIVPPARSRYLSEVADMVRRYHARVARQSAVARECQQLNAAQRLLAAEGGAPDDPALQRLAELAAKRSAQLDEDAQALLTAWPDLQARYAADQLVTQVRGHERSSPLVTHTLSGMPIRKVLLPAYHDTGDILCWLMRENVPGAFPYTAGVFPLRRDKEEPTRMFAGEGDAFRTNRRFHLLSSGMPAKRLSTAFDSVTLYGEDPAERPDIYGKIGNAGVSIATLDDMQALYAGFDLCDPDTSVSMTINGPAPTVLAMFLQTAIRQRVERFTAEQGRVPDVAERAQIEAETLRIVRGTVQADILKEDQGQNTCIFSTDFSLKMMGDIQAYFIEHEVRNFYSVSISGYHIAEAGANPISQLAFTLANGLTYVEAYLARGMHIDAFAPNLSFFFSNGMDPEYSVLGRVARRIWAIAMRDRYGANARSQKLKYHVQTSGRSLHAQEIAFNDIRTTLQALIALYDNCNSLHTNAYDEAVTTPSAESVRRALAIQLIINREWGPSRCENPNQGSFLIESLTDLVEEAVLREFDRLTERGGVLGAMETGYQRGRIQDESMLYEQRKHDGTLPIVGVNTFLAPAAEAAPTPELARSTEAEKHSQLARLAAFHARHAGAAPAMLTRLQQAVLEDANVFAVLMDAVQVCSLGQITHALFEVGGQYRRTM
ncbi:fused isobutyryl-CoA mutase/GTPase IcmF [Imbroritus primus]|uniref:fused isobutyryl-CoA mutase/GTPase IcmF n=1 Tax=Imbroritus primus TaxID=3058603 RepID=UPI003D162046